MVWTILRFTVKESSCDPTSQGERTRIMVTGSSRLDVFRRGGDSSMGRYFLYRMRPFSVGEVISTDLPTVVTRPPRPPDEREWAALWEHGGFPEPFLRREAMRSVLRSIR